jgi:hypothetical protein
MDGQRSVSHFLLDSIRPTASNGVSEKI